VSNIHIVEVGARDGLQNVKDLLTFEQKTALIQYLLDRGFPDVEAGSFVRADRVPQMAESDRIADALRKDHSRLWYLTPNQKGLEEALKHGVTQVAFFTAASETFNQKNIGMTVEDSINKILASITWLKNQGYNLITDWKDKPGNVIARSEATKQTSSGSPRASGPRDDSNKYIKIRVYISTVIGCPYEGLLNPYIALDVLKKFLGQPISQFSLGDTIGVGTPLRWKKLLREIDNLDSTLIAKNRIAMHCHNTYGTALACVAQGLDWNVQTFDASIGGLGGCPFAPGATGNLATEDLLYFLEAEGIKTDVALKDVLETFQIDRTGNLLNRSSVFCALSKKK